MIKIDKLFRDKKGSSVIYILLAMGIMLLVFGSTPKNEAPQNTQSAYDSRTTEAENILSEIKGAGKVSVMISDGENKEKSSLTSIRKEEKESVGVLIVADGGSDGAVCERLIRAASVALGVSPHKIEVFERK